MEFTKIQRLLQKNPKVLKEDPLLGIDYLRIINLIKRKKLVENTSDEFDPKASIDSTYLDLDLIDKEEIRRKHDAAERFQKEMDIESTASTGERLQLEDQEAETSVR